MSSPAAAVSAFARALSMHRAEASTPEPVYGRPSSSSIPCTVPSSPSRPCRALKTHWKSPSRSTSHVPRSTSTPVTSWPRRRSAFPTWEPDMSEPSGWRTGRPAVPRASSLEPPPHLPLGLELDVEAPPDLGLDAIDEPLHVGRRGPALVDDEVAVHRRDHGAPFASALEAGGLHQAAG